MIDELCESIVVSCEEADWSTSLTNCISDPNNIESLNALNEIQQLSSEHDLDLYSAALLYHSNKEV
jgi:hypothetical protein